MARRGKQPLEFGLFLVGPVVALLTTPILARALGPEERGELGVSLAVVSIVATISALGMPQVLLADSADGRDTSAVRRLAIIGSLVGAALGGGVSMFLGLPVVVSLLIALAVPAAIAPQIWTSASLWGQGTLRVAVSAAAAGVIRLVAIPVLAGLGLLTLGAALTLQAFVLLLVGGALLLPFVRRLPSERRSRTLPEALLAGAPVVGFGVLTAVTLRADLITLQLASDEYQVGIYAAVVAVTQAALAVSTFFRNRAQAGIAGGLSGMAVWRYPLALAGIGAVGIAAAQFFAQPLCDILFGSEYEGAASVMRVLAVAAAMQMLLDVGQGMLIAAGKRGPLLGVAAVGATATILMLLLLVPHMGAVGAAVAATAGGAVSVVVAFVLLLGGWRNIPREARGSAS